MPIKRRDILAAGATAMLGLPGAARSQAAPLLIDSHVHVWARDPRFPFAPGASPPDIDASVEALLALMQANGVSRTVLIQVIHYLWDNSYLASVLHRYPRLFHGVCRVNPQDPAAPDHLTRLTEEQGFQGVRLSPAADARGDWISGPLMAPLWRRTAQLRVPMTLLIPVQRLPQVVPLIESNPDLTVVIDHMADSPLDHPQALDFLLDLAAYPRVFVKISHMWSLSHRAYPHPDAAAQVRRLYDTFGAGRLMWGTDWPICLKNISYAQAVALFRDHMSLIPEHDHAQILSQTVQKIWPFGL